MPATALGASGTRPQTRRRGEELVHAVYAATVEQLCTVGYQKLSMEGIAAAARTGKAALYRRWRTTDELVRDALGDLLPEPPELAAGISLRAGLLTVLDYLNDALFDSKRAAFQAVAAETGADNSMLRTLFYQRVLDPCQSRIVELISRNVADAASIATATLISSVAPALVMYDCMFGRSMLTRAQLESMVDSVLLPLAHSIGNG